LGGRGVEEVLELVALIAVTCGFVVHLIQHFVARTDLDLRFALETDILGTDNNYRSLSIRDLLQARDLYHYYLLNKPGQMVS